MKILTLEQLENKKKKIERKLKKIDENIQVEKAKTLVECTFNNKYGKGCGQKFEISSLTYIQTHWYEPPVSCMGGDMWHESEGQFVCPSCSHRNRLYDRPEIQKLKYLFKDIKREYKD